MNSLPFFYLASVDSSPALAPRKCFIEERLIATEGRDDYLRVRIEPPIVGQPYGLGARNIDQVVLATRYSGATLHPINEWPMVVFVCRIINDRVIGSGKASANDLNIILIGELYQNLDEARKNISREERQI